GGGPQPHRGELREHAAGARDRRVPGGSVAKSRSLEIAAQMAPVGGRQPIHRPPEERAQRVQNRERKPRREAHQPARHLVSLQPRFCMRTKSKHMSDFLFTSESVSEGHPDKVADQISDAVLDAILKQDKTSRAAAETLVKDNLVVLAGEITTGARVNYNDVTRNTIKRIGYNDPAIGFDTHTCTVIVAYGEQSKDIAQG